MNHPQGCKSKSTTLFDLGEWGYEGFSRIKGYELTWPSSVSAVNNIIYPGLEGDDPGFCENPKPGGPVSAHDSRPSLSSPPSDPAFGNTKAGGFKPSGIGDEKPISGPLCAESDVFDDLQNSTAGTKA
ncbi:hypothetical protein FH972_006694 [Carpinus fangiana]|uniref:Uncharacterized protein n=1 Tax=Carpinus fangiana TaxID=176857 RepID=A0A5N6QWL5_9ROSI|nr:hypothetical protein FH972_006694 [Carpinus fangiana]